MGKQRVQALLGPVLMLWGCLAVAGAAVSGWDSISSPQGDATLGVSILAAADNN